MIVQIGGNHRNWHVFCYKNITLFTAHQTCKCQILWFHCIQKTVSSTTLGYVWVARGNKKGLKISWELPSYSNLQTRRNTKMAKIHQLSSSGMYWWVLTFLLHFGLKRAYTTLLLFDVQMVLKCYLATHNITATYIFGRQASCLWQKIYLDFMTSHKRSQFRMYVYNSVEQNIALFAWTICYV